MARATTFCISSGGTTAPVGLFGELTIIIRVLGVMRLAASAAVKAKFFSWSVATSTALPPA